MNINTTYKGNSFDMNCKEFNILKMGLLNVKQLNCRKLSFLGSCESCNK